MPEKINVYLFVESMCYSFFILSEHANEKRKTHIALVSKDNPLMFEAYV